MTQFHHRPTGLSGLFDFSFSRFITIAFIRGIYILGMSLIGIGWLLYNLTTFYNAVNNKGAEFAVVVALLMLLISTLIAFVYLVFLRVGLEVIVVIFRIGENTSAIVAAQGASPPGDSPVAPPRA